MDRTSPKSKDLLRDPRYALHSLVTDSSGTGGEFVVSGRAALIEDAALAAALEEGMENAGRYLLFELSPEEAMSTVYEGEAPVRHRWRA